MTPRPEARGLLCRQCGGEMIRGDLAIPILGSARFSYRVGTLKVETEIDTLMCASCGGVVLKARDPDRIRRAHNALKRVEGEP